MEPDPLVSKVACHTTGPAQTLATNWDSPQRQLMQSSSQQPALASCFPPNSAGLQKAAARLHWGTHRGHPGAEVAPQRASPQRPLQVLLGVQGAECVGVSGTLHVGREPGI